MKLRISYLLFACILAGQPRLQISPESGNELHLYVEKTGVLSGKKHDFTFTDYSGQIEPDTAVRFILKSASIVCKDTWVSAKDLPKVTKAATQDMLAIDKYPTVEFHSTSVKKLTDNTYEAVGPLSIRDKTKDVTVHVRQTAPMTYEGSAKFKMSEFGLKPPSAALGLVGTKDEMTFVFSLKAH